VGAEDYWHVPAVAPTLRQRLVDNSPVVATAIRVPGGDVEHRSYAATVDGQPTVVVEVENQTPTPVAIGFTLHSLGVAARDATGVSIGERHMLRFSHQPRSEFVGAPMSLFVVPLAHRAVVRVTAALEGDAPEPVRAPGADAAARGWRALAATGTSVSGTPFDDALDTARAFLHLHAARLRLQAKRADRALAAAVADALTLTGCDDDAGAMRLACRLRPARAGLPLVVPLDAGGVPALPGEGPEKKRDLTSAPGAAAAVRAIYARLVADGGDTLDLLGGIDVAGNRSPVEVHGLPVAGGTLGVALRWHGERPALLWDLDTTSPRRLTASAIDRTWSTTEPRGEALLAAPAAGTKGRN